MSDQQKNKSAAKHKAVAIPTPKVVKLPPYNDSPAGGQMRQMRQMGQMERGEIGGPKGLEPTRYGDWESKGRCHDF